MYILVYMVPDILSINLKIKYLPENHKYLFVLLLMGTSATESVNTI